MGTYNLVSIQNFDRFRIQEVKQQAKFVSTSQNTGHTHFGPQNKQHEEPLQQIFKNGHAALTNPSGKMPMLVDDDVLLQGLR